MPVPAVLLADVSAGQHAARSLHREAQPVQQFSHVARMIADAEFFLDHPGNHGRGPQAAVQAVGHGTTIENVPELLPLSRRQAGRPS